MRSGNPAPDAEATSLRAGLRDSFLYLMATAVGRGSLILAVPLFTRLLPAGDFGHLDLMMAAITLVCAALLFGTDSGVAAEYATCDPADARRLGRLFRLACTVPCLLALAAAAVLGLVQMAGWLDRAMARSAWLILACGWLLALSNCAIALLRWTARARQAALLLGLLGAAPILAAAAAVLFAPSLLAAQIGLATGYLAATALCLLLSGQHLGPGSALPASGLQEARALLALSWPMGLASLALPMRRSSERVLVLALLGESALAAYAVLTRMAQVVEIGLQAIGNGFYPRALRALAEPGGQRLAVRTLQLFWLASLVATLAAAVGAGPLVALYAGPGYAAAAPLLPAAVAIACLAALPYCAGMAFFHARRIGLYAALLVLGAALVLAVAAGALQIEPTLLSWFYATLGAAALVSCVFLAVAERIRPVGYSLVQGLTALVLLAAFAAARLI